MGSTSLARRVTRPAAEPSRGQRDQCLAILFTEKAASNHSAIRIRPPAKGKRFFRLFNESGYRKKLDHFLSMATDEAFVKLAWAVDALQSGRRDVAREPHSFSD
jgi:hypothetical protein